jgi:pilus assembly protein Flp/PilA
MLSRLTTLARCARGATAIEYALIAGLICVAIIGSLRALGGSSNGAWAVMSNKVITQLPGA